ncbi:MAG: DNA glycosylase AlkZ-like family protein [Gaiellaceae bacterium]
MKVTADVARRFLVARQFLAPARSLPSGPDGVMEVFRRFGSIQFDPLAIAGRNHDLVLHARVANYDPSWCDELYARREIYEAFNKGLSLIPARDYPSFRGRLSKTSQNILDENRDVADQVVERIRAEGPLSSLDFERKTGTTTDWFGAPTNVVRAVLEAAAVTGVLGLARRDGNRRYYDLAERLLPRDVLKREIPIREQLKFRLLSRYRAHGLLGVGGGGDVFGGLGSAKPDPERKHPGRNALREELVEDGELVPVDIEGLRGKRLVLRDEVGLLEAPPAAVPSVAFLPPFDAFVWDRKFLAALFGFEYVWELFFPPEKRRWGWYVLPMLFGDRLVGRIEPRIDREAARVEILGLWWEDGFAPKRVEGFVDALRDALHAYLRFAGVDGIEWAPHLSAAKRLFASDEFRGGARSTSRQPRSKKG